MINPVLGPPVELGGEHQAGAHRLAPPGDGEEDGRLRVGGEPEGHLEAAADQPFVLLLVFDVVDFDAVFIGDGVDMIASEGDRRRINPIVGHVAVVETVAGGEEPGMDHLLPLAGGDDVNGVHAPSLLMEGVEGLRNDLGAQAHDGQEDVFHCSPSAFSPHAIGGRLSPALLPLAGPVEPESARVVIEILPRPKAVCFPR